jgi:TolB-like protein/Tfp pilus assembly protein PilF
MKRCPECRRDYYDDSLLYCLDDGSALLDGPASRSPDQTQLTPDRTSEAHTQVLKDVFSSPERSIAVLPFVNISADPENDYFCDGLAEELLNALTKIDGLKVAARTSAFSFKGSHESIASICQQLGVNCALEGSVRKSGDRLRITVQMVNPSDGYHLWSERYDRKMRDIFEIQDEITLAVIDALKVKLLGTERSAILKRPTLSSEAFDLYLRARAFWNKRTIEGFERAIDFLEQAIRLDQKYALAYAALADCYSFMAYFEWFAPAQMGPKAKTAVENAMRIDPQIAECHTAMAIYRFFFEFDLDAAEREFQAAIDINPSFPEAHYLYASLLAAMGRLDKAISEGQVAVALDPLSPLANMTLSRALCYAGRPAEAIDRIESCLEIAPGLWFLEWLLGCAYGQIGDESRSIEYFKKAAITGGFRIYSYLGNALIRGGRGEEAQGLLDALKEASATSFVSPIAEAVIEAELGDMSRGLDLLDEAWAARIVHLTWAGIDHVFDVFRGERRFDNLLARLGLV